MYCYLIILTFFNLNWGQLWTMRPSCWSSQERFQNSSKIGLYPLPSKELLKGTQQGRRCWNCGEGYSQWLGCSCCSSTEERCWIPHLWGLQGDGKWSSGCWPVPLLNLSGLFATLAGGKQFTNLDLSHPLPNPSELFATLVGARNLLSLTYLIHFQTPVNCLLHLLVERNLLSLIYRRLIGNFCWIRNQPSMLQLILIKGYIDITDFLLV